MCAIVGSFDLKELQNLVKLNAYRGQHSHSFSQFNPATGEIEVLAKKLGDFKLPEGIKEALYYIAHTQAPTTDAKDEANIHPHKIGKVDEYLWHNGILKEDCIERLQYVLGMEDQKWDTALLHNWLDEGESLSKIDGTFSCLEYLDNRLFLFRNEISPMFIDMETFTISSTRFPGSIPTKPNIAWDFDLINMQLVKNDEFTTKENPYYFG